LTQGTLAFRPGLLGYGLGVFVITEYSATTGRRDVYDSKFCEDWLCVADSSFLGGLADGGGMLRAADVVRLCGMALLCIGLLGVHSAGLDASKLSAISDQTYQLGLSSLSMFASKHTALALVAIVGMMLASQVDASKMLSRRGVLNPLWIAVPIAVVLCVIVLMPGVGSRVNGAWRWLVIPGTGVSFQPSEVMKWVMVAAVATWCGLRCDRMKRFWYGLVPIGLLIAIGCGLIMKEDLGTACLIGAVAMVLLIAGGARLWQLLPLVLAGAGAAVGVIANSEFRMRRLTAFLDPWSDPMGDGYHPIQSMVSFAEGGLMGRGLGHSIQKYHVPEDTTDFILPVLSEELGLVGIVVVMALYLAILWAGVSIVRQRTEPLARLLAFGIVLTVLLQAAMNMAVVTVMVPTKGIALPLVSAGGTGWVMTAVMLGVLAGLEKRETSLEGSADLVDSTDLAKAAEPPEPALEGGLFGSAAR